MSQSARTETLLRRLGRGESDLLTALGPGRVEIVLAEPVAREPQAQMTLSFLVNLVARLYPVVQTLHVVVPQVRLLGNVPRWRAEEFGTHVASFLTSLAPPIAWSVTRARAEDPVDLHVAVGPGAVDGSGFQISSDGWQCSLHQEPVACSWAPNPIGAYTAACFAAAEVWKRLLYPHRDLFPGTPIVPTDGELRFSAFDYEASSHGPNPAVPEALDLGRLTIVGLGAGGSALAYTLASVPGLSGLATLIEPDTVEEPNLNRYVIADKADADRSAPKARLAGRVLAQGTALEVRELPEPFGDVVQRLEVADFEQVVAAVHSREARREIQYETPKILWDAGATDQGDFFIWRLVQGVTECMWCKHPPEDNDPEQEKAEQLAALLGLDAGVWLRKQRNNEVFSEAEIASISECPLEEQRDFDLPVAGERYSDWEAAQCGRLRLAEIDAEVPMPFAPVLAGVLLAGEVLKERYARDLVLDSYYWNTLLGRFLTALRPHRRLPRNGCQLCQDDVMKAQYVRRWS